MTVVIIDYGLGNLASVRRALEKRDADVLLSDDPQSLKTAERIILPGVGSFADGMHNLNAGGWTDVIRREVLENHVPILGICLGMQLLADVGHEGGKTKGLGLIRGEVRRLEPKDKAEKIPHVGWNEIQKRNDTPLLAGIPSGADFYFVHSYYVDAEDKNDIAAVTRYAGEFPSVLARNNVFGGQFHPEKSQRFGARLLCNFLELSC
jgi:imidazole glycerol-phosphate synthase subunit HisH